MRILAVETSCDETAIALLDIEGGFDNANVTVLGNALLSQVGIHKEYGGVFPTLAKREHQKNLIPLLKKVLNEAGQLKPKSSPTSNFQLPTSILEREPELLKQFLEFIPTARPVRSRTRSASASSNGVNTPDIDLIAVTNGPGLEPALWVGINFAKALAWVWRKPVIPVDHMEGHIVSALLKAEKINPKSKTLNPKQILNSKFQILNIQFPVLALLISGGHTELVLMRDWLEYEVLGETLDDAVGEAFDKVARMLELPYPGGPEISALAESARNSAEQTRKNAEKILRQSASGQRKSARQFEDFKLPRPMLRSDNFNFSFAGLKTAVLYTLKKIPILTDGVKQQIAKEFEDAATEVLVHKTRKALEAYGAKSLLIGGGVSANTHIQREMKKMIEKEFPDAVLHLPDKTLTGDNAIMIAAAAYFRTLKGMEEKEIVADGNQRL